MSDYPHPKPVSEVVIRLRSHDYLLQVFPVSSGTLVWAVFRDFGWDGCRQWRKVGVDNRTPFPKTLKRVAYELWLHAARQQTQSSSEDHP